MLRRPISRPLTSTLLPSKLPLPGLSGASVLRRVGLAHLSVVGRGGGGEDAEGLL